MARVDHREDDLSPEGRIGAINYGAGYDSRATNWYVDHPHPFRPGQILVVPRTKERVLVEGVTPDRIVVRRGFGAAALVDNDPLFVEEDSSGPIRRDEDWDEYDRRVENLSGDEAREALKREARLRDQLNQVIGQADTILRRAHG